MAVCDECGVPVPTVDVVLDVLRDAFEGCGIHTGGSYGVEYDSKDKDEFLVEVARKLVARLTSPAHQDSARPMSGDPST